MRTEVGPLRATGLGWRVGRVTQPIRYTSLRRPNNRTGCLRVQLRGPDSRPPRYWSATSRPAAHIWRTAGRTG